MQIDTEPLQLTINYLPIHTALNRLCYVTEPKYR